MTRLYIDFLKTNLFDCSLDTVKYFTVTESRPDLNAKIIQGRFQIKYFSPFEKPEYWQHEDFDYDISCLGFRDADLPTELDVGFFGCSFTFGQALPLHRLYHKILSKKLNISSYNFGQPAASVRTLLSIFTIVSQYVKMKYAIFLLPPYTRQTITTTPKDNINNINNLNIMPGYYGLLQSLYDVDSENFYKYTPDTHLQNDFITNLYHIEQQCKLKNIKTIFASWDSKTYNILKSMYFKYAVLGPEWSSNYVENYQTDLARDNRHPGIRHHENYVERLIEYIRL